MNPDPSFDPPAAASTASKKRSSDSLASAAPIAIVGMACRFPGATGLAAFWKQLENGECAVIEGSPGSGSGRIGELFPDSEVQSKACRFGAYLDRLDLFDAAFFRISPVEAQLLDPQQRLMLETSWQALEDACMDPEQLRGSRTGVYAGISNNDYRNLLLEASDTAEPAVSLYTVTGTSFNTAIGRVAFMLGLEGPAMAVDTACSSSLVATHQAVSGLQRGETDLALAGGVHTILSGRLLELRANAGMLSPDGRCKTFDAAANGYVRGEGCGIVVLKRLVDAEADGDRIWGVIRGSALNQDGASPGLTVPNGAAQEKVLEEALRRAGISPFEVDYVEAHGTGTEVGDPIELQATSAVYGRGREAEHPLLIGSVKTNIGHLESAAGVAGLIKVILAMKRGVIPKHLHFHNPTPQMDWERLPVQVTSEATEWPHRKDRPPLAGISGFGWSGTNAHLVVEGYGTLNAETARQGPGSWVTGDATPVAMASPKPGAGLATSRARRLLPLSGKSPRALAELIAGYQTWLDGHAQHLGEDNPAWEALLANMAWTAAVGRSHFEYRAGVVFEGLASLRAGLEALTRPEAPASAPGSVSKVAFVYTGQASQWPGMGESLYACEPVARAVLDRCEAWCMESRGGSLLDVMFGRCEDSRVLDDPAWTQPAIYALECALTALWKSVGIGPEIVVGHSLGEIAAAQAAGVFSLEDGLRFASERGALMAGLSQDGAMGAVFAPPSEVQASVDEHNAKSAQAGLSIAADNGAHQVVSGPAVQVEDLLQQFESHDTRVRRLKKSPAYHSPLVEPVLDDLEAVLGEVAVKPPSLDLISSMTGEVLGTDERMDGAYWRQQVRQPVLFAKCIAALARHGVDLVVEIGPHAVLGPMIALTWPGPADGAGHDAPPPVVLQSLQRPAEDALGKEPAADFTDALAGAYEAGLTVSWAGLFAGEERRRLSLPGYPFQRERHWVKTARRTRSGAGHPLLGTRHESARGEITYDSEILPSDPDWLSDHRVFGRIIAPGAFYGAMAVSASLAERSASAAVQDLQLHNPLVFQAADSDEDAQQAVRQVQVVIDSPEEGQSRRFQLHSRSAADEGWMLHAEARLETPPELRAQGNASSADMESLKSALDMQDVQAFYRARSEAGIDLGPAFRTLQKLWCGLGEAVGEVAIPQLGESSTIEFHPLLLDGCFQVMGAARLWAGAEEGATYLPFGWDRLWLSGKLSNQVLCHVRMRTDSQTEIENLQVEVLTGDIRLYDPSGMLVGELEGYTVKRATRSALLAAVEGLEELLYEVVWRDRALPSRMMPADFLPSPSTAASRSQLFSRYLADEGVEAADESDLQGEMERASWCYALAALETLGWERVAGAVVDPEELRARHGVLPEHAHLLRRLLEILARSGVLQAEDEGFVATVGAGDPLPDEMPHDSQVFLDEITARFPHATNEVGLFKRCAGALPEVLCGKEDPLSLLFGDAEPQAGDLYRRAPVWRAANRMMGEVVRTLVEELPDGRPLRVLEVGAGIGSATECILPVLPAGRFEYMYTDISAGFFADAEARFSAVGAAIDYRVLDIEKDPVAQGFELHAYDMIIAANVLHATRFLDETLTHCRTLLAPSGLLVALENQRSRGWMDLIFGQLDGWWRFADRYRTNHALAGPDVWHRVLTDTGFTETEILGVDRSDTAGLPDRGVIVAQGPAEIALPEGVWIIAADRGGMGAALAAQLAALNQRVVLAGDGPQDSGTIMESETWMITPSVEMGERTSWQALIENLPSDVPLAGVVHLVAQDGHGMDATTADMASDAKRVTASALALVQGIVDADAVPEKGLWLVTRGAQVLERERSGQLAGATLWGLGKVVAREAPQLQSRMIDLDPESGQPLDDLMDELLFPDSESHIAYRQESRQVARLVRADSGTERLVLPEEADWVLAPGDEGVIETLRVQSLARQALEPNEVRVAVDARGLNFLDVFRAMGLVEEGLLGEEFCGRIVETGADVTAVAEGDRVAGFAFGTFGPEVVTREELVARAPANVPAAALATIPSVFVTSVLSYELAGLKAGDRVLIHAGAGGVGLAAIQLAQVAGAEVFATASARKQAYLRSIGVEHVFDSRSTAFGRDILDVTDGAGVDVVLNSLTGEGFIEASLTCLAQGGRFVELARRDILEEDEMAALRPDVAYSILDLYTLKQQDPARPGAALKDVLARIASGELAPLMHTRWPLTETSAAMGFMRAARHIGKIVLTTSPLGTGRLRQDGTYLVTGGLGGIGCALAEWLAEHGAGTVVLNGRRPPDAAAEKTIEALCARGYRIEVEIADVTDAAALDAMLARVDADLPMLAGVIHSVGILSDAALGNQSWESFEAVLWPKVLGAWHLHRATAGYDLDMFILFSSVAGILGNPGQANHAAANAFLDQLAAHRRALGLPGQAIAWGAWSGLGKAEEQRERIAGRREAFGTGWFTPEQGFRALERLLHQDATGAVAAAVDWPVFGDSVGDRLSLLDELLADAADDGDDSSSSEDLLAQLDGTPQAGREDLLVSFLQREVQAVLRLPSAPASAVGFFDLGMDSLMAVELRNRLNRDFSGSYAAPNTLVFDYPTIDDLARHLVGALGESAPAPEMAPETAPETAPAPGPLPVVQSRDEGIAIIGMACRFPGAPDTSTFWRKLESGSDAVTDARTDNGPWTGVAGDPAAADGIWGRGGFVEGIDRFDARFFGMTPIGARMTDPQQRLLLETSWRAIEDAGIDPEGLRGSRTGVYAGVAASEYRDLMMMAGGEGPNYLGTASSMAVGNVALRLGLTGPAIPVTLNCAASLVAVHAAVADLQDKDVDLTLVGGVNAVLSHGLIQEMAALGMLSKQGRCNTFDAAADGFVRSEGCGMVVLKRLSEAEADGDRIWAVIRGTAVNQNGATAGPTVPNGPAQERVIEEALSQAGIPPSDVDYLEAHGAGSTLGDPIEVQAAAAVFGRGRDRDRPLLIGSVKTNIGHLETAAGVAGLIKVVLAMHHNRIPEHLHFRDPNPHLDWDRLPVRVVSEATDWPDRPDRAPRAGVSAFGISGTNAHVIMEGYGTPNGVSAGPQGTPQPVTLSLPDAAGRLPLTNDGLAPRKKRLLPLSGKSGTSLQALAKRYLAWLDERESALAFDPVLSDMAWTASVGRSHFDHRGAVVFEDSESLRDALRVLVAADVEIEPRIPGKVAFAYAGHANGWMGMDESLYASEPVVRAVLDRCEEVIGEARGLSLLDVMFGRPGSTGDLADPQWERPALYAFECALTALWSSVGIQPGIALGHQVGALAAGQAAGVFSLEDGLRLAAAGDDPGAPLDEIAISAPSLTLVDAVSGRAIAPDEVLDTAYWHQQVAGGQESFVRGVKMLEAAAVDAVVAVGPVAAMETTLMAAWPEASGKAAKPVVLSGLGQSPDGEATSRVSIVDAVAKAYEAGLPVSFAGLFAGESRCRISLPGYPFQRKRYWIETGN